MCYYSKSLRPDQFRHAREGEDLVIASDAPRQGHHFAQAKSDGKIVCMMEQTEVHIVKLQFSVDRQLDVRNYLQPLVALEGKPVTAKFCMRRQAGYSFDCLMIEGHEVHFVYLAAGMEFYTGPKRIEDTLGVSDPSIALDHRTDVAPTHGDMIAKLEPVSIQR